MRGRTKNDGMSANNPGAARSILLANENKRIMVGNPRPPMNTLWIDIEANSRIVGYLGVIQNLDITQEADQLFFSRVKKEMLWIVVAALLVSTLLALPFAYLHLRSTPITSVVFLGILIGISFFLMKIILLEVSPSL